MARTGVLLTLLLCGRLFAGETLRIVVVDESGAPVPEATLAVSSGQGAVLVSALTGSAGDARVTDIPAGTWVLRASKAGFAPRSILLKTPLASGDASSEVTVRLAVRPGYSTVTVTAERGGVDESAAAAAVTLTRGEDSLRESPLATVGNALSGLPSVSVQQSTAAHASPFLRSLTGQQTLMLVDGVRFNQSTFRSGPNQYLAFVDSSQLERAEVVLGPAAVNYGSDSLGGTLQLLTPVPQFSPSGRILHGDFSLLGGTADLSGHSSARIQFGTPRVAVLLGGSGRRHNDVRSGGGVDSRHIFRRYFGMDLDAISGLRGERIENSAFTQAGAQARIGFRPAAGHLWTTSYQFGEQFGVRNSRDTWGGLGRLQGLFTPQLLNLFYTRYETLRAGPLDSLTGTFSINSQEDGFVRQNLRATDPVTREWGRTTSWGYTGQGAGHFGAHNTLVFGGEFYNEHIAATRFENRNALRPLNPNGSRYNTLGLFLTDRHDLLESRLRLRGGVRFTRITLQTFADRNVSPEGRPLGVGDGSQAFHDVTFDASVRYQFTRHAAWSFQMGRGFRAPNLQDLGGLGLNDLGFEIPAEQLATAGASLGNDANDGSLSSGRPVAKLRAESLYNFETGFTFQAGRWYARAQGFVARLDDPIVRRTALFPIGGAPQSLAGIPVRPLIPTPAQTTQGFVGVAPLADPRAIKTQVNDGEARYYGTELLGNLALTRAWSMPFAYSFLVGRDLYPNRNVRRLSPQGGSAGLRYLPPGKPYWLEVGTVFAGPQTRLSGGDFDDERIGASRRRTDIAAIFGGDLVARYVVNGVFTPTGETLSQLQNRVLPLGATIHGVRVLNDSTRVPLLNATAGWLTLDVRGGWTMNSHWRWVGGVSNLLDRNFRVHGSGIDSPGMQIYAGATVFF